MPKLTSIQFMYDIYRILSSTQRLVVASTPELPDDSSYQFVRIAIDMLNALDHSYNDLRSVFLSATGNTFGSWPSHWSEN